MNCLSLISLWIEIRIVNEIVFGCYECFIRLIGFLGIKYKISRTIEVHNTWPWILKNHVWSLLFFLLFFFNSRFHRNRRLSINLFLFLWLSSIFHHLAFIFFLLIDLLPMTLYQIIALGSKILSLSWNEHGKCWQFNFQINLSFRLERQ